MHDFRILVRIDFSSLICEKVEFFAAFFNAVVSRMKKIVALIKLLSPDSLLVVFSLIVGTFSTESDDKAGISFGQKPDQFAAVSVRAFGIIDGKEEDVRQGIIFQRINEADPLVIII